MSSIGGAVGSSDALISSAELEAAKQEIGMLKEEVAHNRLTIDNLRVEQQVTICSKSHAYCYTNKWRRNANVIQFKF